MAKNLEKLNKNTPKSIKNMIKFDTHVHSSGASVCSMLSPKELVLAYKRAGFGGFMMTNHLSKRQMRLQKVDEKQNVDCAINDYLLAKVEGEKCGITVILGAEVAVSTTPKSQYSADYSEFLLYGVSEKLLMDNLGLCHLSQSELYQFCQSNSILMYQAHPFRFEHGQEPQDPRFMDGVEINYHGAFIDQTKATTDFANNHNLALTCGSDTHVISQVGNAGIYIGRDITSAAQLAQFMWQNRKPSVFVGNQK